MTILNSEKIVWQTEDQILKIIAVDEHTLGFRQTHQSKRLYPSQIYEMMRDIAAYFGKRVKFQDIPLACPNCRGEVFTYVKSGKYLKKQCESCGVSGPLVESHDTYTDETAADLAWLKLFYPEKVKKDKGPITIEEELARR